MHERKKLQIQKKKNFFVRKGKRNKDNEVKNGLNRTTQQK